MILVFRQRCISTRQKYSDRGASALNRREDSPSSAARTISAQWSRGLLSCSLRTLIYSHTDQILFQLLIGHKCRKSSSNIVCLDIFSFRDMQVQASIKVNDRHPPSSVSECIPKVYKSPTSEYVWHSCTSVMGLTSASRFMGALPVTSAVAAHFCPCTSISSIFGRAVISWAPQDVRCMHNDNQRPLQWL